MDDLFHRLHRGGQDLVGSELVGMLGQAVFEADSPGYPEFGVDVDEADACSDCFAQVLVGRP
jgi:hypothetical protein